MSITFTWRNFDEFMSRIKEVEKEFPKTSEQYLRRIGNKLKKKAKGATPVGKQKKADKKRMKNRWSSKIAGGLGDFGLEYQLHSKAPHFHLVERGHILYTHKKYKGYVQGKYFFRKTADEFVQTGEIRREMEKFMNAIKRKIET